MHTDRASGFTLIEMLIVLAMIGILSAIAYPSYTDYLRRSHRSEARAALLQAQLWMERVATATGAYPVTSQPQQAPALLQLQEQLSTARYGIEIISSDGVSFALLATPRAAQQADACGWLRLDQTGARSAEGGSIATCWER